MNNNLIWVIGLIIIFGMLCGTLIHLNRNAFTVRFEMDNNTLEAVKSIEWDNLGEQKPYQGPVPEGANETHFRKIGETKWKNQ